MKLSEMEGKILLKPDLYYIIFSALMFFFMLVFIPRQMIRKLFWFGMLWGSTFDFLLESAFCFFHILRYEHIQPFNVGYLSIWTVLAWTPTNMMLIYFLPESPKKYVFWVYILMYSGLTALIGIVLVNLGLLVFVHWNAVCWFVFGVVYYYLMVKHYRSLMDGAKRGGVLEPNRVG